MTRVLVIGAGIGGLSAAAVLAKAGLDVTVLEAHIYPGGCAGTFYHQGYRFDAGATLAGGFYPGGPMDLLGRMAGVDDWRARPADPAMVVHLPDGRSLPRRAGEDAPLAASESERRAEQEFWRWQQRTANHLWDLALRSPAWPPQTPAQAAQLGRTLLEWALQDPLGRLSPRLAADALRPAAARLAGAPEDLRLLVDAQLLISAQATAQTANALYAASALDLPRRGVIHLPGGMGAIAETLAAAIRRHAGRVLYRTPVTRILTEDGRAVGVEARHGERFDADIVIANLTPWNIRDLMQDAAPQRLQRLPAQPQPGWGAFIVYAGIDAAGLPAGFPLHHQVIAGRPFGEGRTVFLSLSPDWDAARAPGGHRALTISTHTRLEPWWELYHQDRPGYEARKTLLAERLLQSAGRAIPDLRARAALILPGTPVTFERFTHRKGGWVGGFPQTSLFQAWGPRLAPGLWMVGDSIFPGQSTAAAVLGGMRVAEDVRQELAGLPRRPWADGYSPSGD